MFWLGHQLKSGVGFAARHTGDKHIATLQLATTGIVSAQYAHRVRGGDGGKCCMCTLQPPTCARHTLPLGNPPFSCARLTRHAAPTTRHAELRLAALLPAPCSLLLLPPR
jgi:hypothetical protein